MELATLELPDKAAVANLIEKFDHPMMPVLRAAAEGQQVVDIQEVFAAGGLNEQGLPKLAFSNSMTSNYWKIGETHHCGPIDFPNSALRLSRKRRWQNIDVYADCPPVPKDISRLKNPSDLYCWEVDRWERRPRQQLADPVLLRPIQGRYYTVVAQWDLTPLERELFAAVLPE